MLTVKQTFLGIIYHPNNIKYSKGNNIVWVNWKKTSYLNSNFLPQIFSLKWQHQQYKNEEQTLIAKKCLGSTCPGLQAHSLNSPRKFSQLVNVDTVTMPWVGTHRWGNTVQLEIAALPSVSQRRVLTIELDIQRLVTSRYLVCGKFGQERKGKLLSQLLMPTPHLPQ